MEYMRLMQYGTRGEDVRAAKDRLLELGYLHASTHDRFGSDTRAAVRAFQTACGLTADGVIGEHTWTALFGSAQPAASIEKAAPSEQALAVCALALTRIGDLYVWGASGMSDLSDAAIRAKDGEADRAIRFSDRQQKAGMTDLLAHDCSGFISWLFRQCSVWDTRRDCDGLWGRCTAVQKAELIPGDLLFRGTDGDKTHVGLYLGGGRVVHCKGRDVGVVLEGVDAEGSGYWRYFGRCGLLKEEKPT